METSAKVIGIRVRDTYCGVKGRYEESLATNHAGEAAQWLKQWKQEYNREDGYKVERKEFDSAEAAHKWVGWD